MVRNVVQGLSFVAALVFGGTIRPLQGGVVTFHTEAPIPDADDIYNFVGGSRDGLNVNDDNGLDGPLNDQFTYVAPDQPRQGQIFKTPTPTGFLVSAVWVKVVGYTDNGLMPEPGFNGTESDLSSGGVLFMRMRRLRPPAAPAIMINDSYTLTGLEPNNPNGVGRSSTTNGSGVWLRWAFDETGSGPGTVGVGGIFDYTFDFVSKGPSGRFELLGTITDAYSAGAAYNGNELGANSTTGEITTNVLNGDRVFLLEMRGVPEPGAASLAFAGALFLPLLRRRASC